MAIRKNSLSLSTGGERLIFKWRQCIKADTKTSQASPHKAREEDASIKLTRNYLCQICVRKKVARSVADEVKKLEELSKQCGPQGLIESSMVSVFQMAENLLKEIDTQFIQKQKELDKQFDNHIDRLEKQVIEQKADNLEQEKRLQELSQLKVDFEKLVHRLLQNASATNIKPPLPSSLRDFEEAQFLLA